MSRYAREFMGWQDTVPALALGRQRRALDSKRGAVAPHAAYTLAVQYQAQKTGQIGPGLKVHELKPDNRAVCGNSRREPIDDRGPGTVTCEAWAEASRRN